MAPASRSHLAAGDGRLDEAVELCHQRASDGRDEERLDNLGHADESGSANSMALKTEMDEMDGREASRTRRNGTRRRGCKRGCGDHEEGELEEEARVEGLRANVPFQRANVPHDDREPARHVTCV